MTAPSDPKPKGARALAELYRRTGLPVSDCARLLYNANGDFDKALELRSDPKAPLPPTVPIYRCPRCSEPLPARQTSECPKCLWLRRPSARTRWGLSGPCPRCGFSYRFDGARCSHCGRGTTDQPPLGIPLSARPPTPRGPTE